LDQGERALVQSNAHGFRDPELQQERDTIP
jgi:hypothetical protein